jgi:hypothetical protein
MPKPRLARSLRVAAFCAAALALTPTAASAADGAGCDPSQPVAQVFALWNDTNWYRLAPGGDFEPGSAGWTLKNGAKIVLGNATQKVGGADDRYSLLLPPGASATSPSTCVSIDEPTFRLFTSGQMGSSLQAQAVYSSMTIPAGFAFGGPWMPTMPMLTGSGKHGAEFSIRLTNSSRASIRIDDVYIDPYKRS